LKKKRDPVKMVVGIDIPISEVSNLVEKIWWVVLMRREKEKKP